MSVTELRNIRPPRKAKDPPSKNPDSGIPRNFSPVTYNESENFGRIELQLSADSSGTLYPVDIQETSYKHGPMGAAVEACLYRGERV